MSIKDFSENLRQDGIVAIVRVDDLSGAVPLVQALRRGGINIIEFTLTNPAAVDAIKAVRDGIDASEQDRLVLGVGSVKTMQQAQQCLEGGAEFIVSPITNFDIIKVCNSNEIPIFPGAYTPTEIYQAWEAGATAVKVFPARNLGATYIKDILAPMPELKLVPTGGISAKNIADYIKAGVLAVGVGGSLVDKKAVAAGDWDTIEKAAVAVREAFTKA
ncbi:MAG: bifunctional 4-hydroxy-2-oxoglutarate aldolase/2-dehydro-3-deoxy-phosphogluconate aldolase [Anaerolineae bacterium]|nr:bifunctional 4-hydroxy-2-oxoglutarate aldolase/2-dehydro-3-deoxy-phosphogluconate aldolase [Anaerolineae bacterium]